MSNLVSTLGVLQAKIREGYALRITYEKDYPKWKVTLDSPNGHFIVRQYGPIRALEALAHAITSKPKFTSTVIYSFTSTGGKEK